MPMSAIERLISNRPVPPLGDRRIGVNGSQPQENETSLQGLSDKRFRAQGFTCQIRKPGGMELLVLLQHFFHEPDLRALAIVDIGGEIEEFSILTGASRIKQLLDHLQGAAMMLNHAGQEETVEFLSLGAAQCLHLLRR